MIKSAMHTLDAWLWRSGMHNPLVRAMVRAQAVFAGAALLAGASAAAFSLWPLWFAVGAVIFANVCWGLARHFSRVALTPYSPRLVMGVFLRSGARLLCVGGVLYAALVVCRAPAVALVCGITAGTAVVLGSYALVSLAGRNQ